VLSGMDKSQFVRLPPQTPPPSGALVLSTEMPCDNCSMLLTRGPFRLYFAR
jgi:hypothetical protein